MSPPIPNYPGSLGAVESLTYTRRQTEVRRTWEVSYRPGHRKAPAIYIYFRDRESAVNAMPLIRANGGKRIQLWLRRVDYRQQF